MINFDKFSQEWLKDSTIYLTKHGSYAYGTNIESSDQDFKGVAIPPLEYFLGYAQKFEQAESHQPDLVIYDIRKFFKLAADCNPSIIEVLFTDECDHLINSTAGVTLLVKRQLFLSKKAKFTFSGYAISQLKRIETHRRWLLNPPTHQPMRGEFNLLEIRPIAKEQLGAAEAAIRQELNLESGLPAWEVQANAARQLGYDENFIDYIQREQRYRTAAAEWKQFETWKAERNQARAELERKFGYDTKHAMHLVRLMRMCREILTTGKVNVKRPDAKELLEIRAGAWTYATLMEWAEAQDKELNELYETSNVLPRSPNLQQLDLLCEGIVRDFHDV